MRLEHSAMADGTARFHTTRWSIVIVAAQSQTQSGEAAFAELCKLYWYPLYFLARRRGRSPHDAQDLTQGFFLHLLKNRGSTHVDQLKGKFRSFLLASFQNYLSTEAHRACSVKRGGNCEFVILDPETAESCYQLEPANDLTAQKIFDARCAVTLLGEAMTRLREQYEAQGRTSIFETLKAFVNPSRSQEPLSYEHAANSLGVSLGAVKTLIHRLRKWCFAILREEVARTVSDPAEIDGEIHDLCDALIAAEGRLSR